MAHAQDILDELNLISPLVASLPMSCPYALPAGYFNELPADLLRVIRQSDKAVTILPASVGNPYTVPEGYFSGFASQVLDKVRNESVQVESDIEQLPPLLSKVDRTGPYTLPPGFFDEFPADIVAGVNAIDFVNKELETGSAILNDKKISDAYEVPAGYFDQFSASVLDKINSQQPKKRFSFILNRNLLRYAAAALIAGVITVAGSMFFQSAPDSLPRQAVTGIDEISNDEMVRYLENTPSINTEEPNLAIFAFKETDVQELLTDVSDEALKQYLDQNVTDSRDGLTN